MRLEQTKTPSLAETLSTVMHHRIADIHTGLPGKVVSYNPVNQTANIQPMLMRNVINIDGSENLPEILPELPNVPVMFPRAGGFFIKFPVARGDDVWLSFGERSLDYYLAGPGTLTDPVDLRMHDLSDAVAFLGCGPFVKSIKEVTNTDLVMGQDNLGAQIHIKDGGVIEITFAAGNMLTVQSTGGAATLQLGNGAKHVAIAEPLATMWGNQNSVFSGHTHICAAPGVASAPPVAVPTPWDATIVSTSTSVPG